MREGVVTAEIHLERRTADIVFRFLQRQIIEGVLKPGERIDTDVVTRELGVSRTPIREALLQLETEGLVERRPYKGAVVRGVDVEFVAETHALRLYLETLAARAGAPRLTKGDLARMADALEKLASVDEVEDQHLVFNRLNREFHDVLSLATGSEELHRHLSMLGRQVERIRMHQDLKNNRNESVDAQHVAIYEACVTGDVQEVVAAVRAHILGTILVSLPPDYLARSDTLLATVLASEEAEAISRAQAGRRRDVGARQGE
jgi:DNA-binding GntR family transcriptional regulator